MLFIFTTDVVKLSRPWERFHDIRRFRGGFAGSALGASRGQPGGFAGSAWGLSGVSLSRGQPWFLVCPRRQDGGEALTIGREAQRKGKGARVTVRTVSWVFVGTSFISASPPIARVKASDASIAGFEHRKNHQRVRSSA